MSRHVDPDRAAAILADAWRSGHQLTTLPEELRPRTVSEGYDIQDRLIAVLNEPVVGWKLGLGSARLKRQTGVGRSVAGRVLGSRRYGAGDTVRLPNAAPAMVEFEIAFVLGRDVLPDGPEPDAREIIAETRVAFELVLSRFVDRRTVGWPSFVADDVGFEALIAGPAIDPARLPELLESLVISVDGAEQAHAATGEDVTDPVTALRDLIAIARERHMRLPAGSLVSTGSASLPFDLAQPEAELVARFLGTELRFRTLVAPRGGGAA